MLTRSKLMFGISRVLEDHTKTPKKNHPWEFKLTKIYKQTNKLLNDLGGSMRPELLGATILCQ